MRYERVYAPENCDKCIFVEAGDARDVDLRRLADYLMDNYGDNGGTLKLCWDCLPKSEKKILLKEQKEFNESCGKFFKSWKVPVLLLVIGIPMVAIAGIQIAGIIGIVLIGIGVFRGICKIKNLINKI